MRVRTRLPCATALNRAENLFDKADRSSEPQRIGYFDESYLAAKFGHCFTALGRGDVAQRFATRSLDMDGRQYARGRQFNLVLLAVAHTQTGEVEEAARVGIDAVDAGEGLHSARARDYLSDLADRLSKHAGLPAVREFTERQREDVGGDRRREHRPLDTRNRVGVRVLVAVPARTSTHSLSTPSGTIGKMTELFARPPAHLRQRLATEPVLASWNAGSHPDQVRLRAYLDEVAIQLDADSWDPDEPRTIELIVGLPDQRPLESGGRDLDNYLFPVARRLGAHHVAAVFGRKVRQHGSTIAVGAAVPAEEPGTSAPLTVRTSVSAESAAWKQTIHQACRDAVTEPLQPGPVALQVVFGVSRHRNWTTLWKPAIDALGHVLGMPNPARPFQPADDRIVDLSLHRHIDDSLGHDVTIEAWWHPAHPQY